MSFQEMNFESLPTPPSLKFNSFKWGTPYFQGLALEGGGVCGLGHVGVIKYLDETNRLENITHFAGSSAGAMMAGLLACRIPYSDLEQILLTLDFRDFEDSKWLLFNDIYRLWCDYGWNQGKNISKIYGKILKQYLGDDQITLGQIREKYGTTLIITATSWKEGKTIYYHPDNDPQLKLVEAVRQSASYPAEFTPCSEGGDLYLDGGVLDNYPIQALDKWLPSDKVFGSKLVNSKPMPVSHPEADQELDPSYSPPQNKLPSNIVGYLKGIIRMYKDLALRIHISPDDWARSVLVNVGTTSTMDFDLSSDSKSWLINQGYSAAQKFFELTTDEDIF